MNLTYGTGGSTGFLILGTCTSAGCPSIRVDNVTFPNWAGHANNGISYGINATGDVFGVLDHNTVTGINSTYLQLVEFNHAKYLGVGQYGDNSWAQSESYGSANFLYIENNLFTTAGATENEGTVDGLANEGGGRVVVRFNTFAEMDNINFGMGWHGTESSGRPRGARAFEFYGNTFKCLVHCNGVASARSGTGLVWGNTIDLSGGASINNLFSLSTYRTEAAYSTWGVCDGSSPYDTNDGITYYSGTVSSGGGSNTITVLGNPWIANQWVSNGSPFSIHNSRLNNGSEIVSNTTNTLTYQYSGAPGDWVPNNGDNFTILRATACLDQAGGRGAGTLFSGDNPSPSSAANQAVSPAYFWSNMFSGGSPAFYFSQSGVGTTTARVIRSRDFYVEGTNQAVQTSATSPFDGSMTVGMGHGTLANRPTTCAIGVGYWATDQGSWNQSSSGGQGQLYLCKTTNTWTAGYTPYTYPHPLVSGGALTAPTNLRVIA
jgi:hypothetical protein